ncbi:MAG TPA: sugar ABC transporter permease [Thermomicrobiales bacterium]|nr:sugar ABC transporter permease [Thermomicrobiales bacterium]
MAITSQQQPILQGGQQVTEKRAWTRYRVTEGVTPYLLVAPLLILIAIFIYWPLVYSLYLSFFDWNFVRPDKDFVGWGNFTRLPDDPRFIQALKGTLFYTVTLVPLQVFLPLFLALLLWPIRKSRLQDSYRAMLFSPTIIAYSVAAVMWLWIFNTNQGVLNKVLVEFGFERVHWLSDRDTAIWVIVVVATWKTLGFHMLLYLAALEGVPKDYVEAAQLDGANNWQLMRSIRFPLITPTFFFVLVTTVISVNDDVFAAINVLTNGGPFDSTTNIIYYLYQQGFQYFQIGAASAVAVIVFIATCLLTWIQFKYVERHVHYG